MRIKFNRASRREQFAKSAYRKIDLSMEARQARTTCRKKLAALGGGYRGSRRLFRSQVLPFWRRYGVKPKKMWYDLYCYKDGAYDPRYIPEELYWQRIYPVMNNPGFRQAYTDKCFYHRLFPHLKQPRTILRNSNHCFYDGSGKIVNFTRAKSILKAEKRFVIKPAIHSGEGTDIYFYDQNIDHKTDISFWMKAYGLNYIVQEVVSQHKVLASIHPESLNTIRVISFLFKGEVHISSAILRMGVAGSRIDNVSAGGLACPIRPNGRLEAKAMNAQFQWLSSHPRGAVFCEIKIPSFEKVLAAIRRTHPFIPHFRIIGWDFSIDEDGEPLFIEYNGAPGMNQVSCGPLFGNLTESVLNTIFLKEP